MSDRTSTQIKFNELLEDYRANVIKESMGAAWDNMSLEEQLVCSRLCNFFCGLHVLVHFADAASISMKENDKGFFGENQPIHNKSFLKSNESGSARLIRTACKAFARGADEKKESMHNFKLI